MLPSCCILLTDFRTVFVFALGPFLPMFVIFGRFPIVIPIKTEKITNMGRKGSRAKTKTVLKSVSKMQQLGSMPNLRLLTFLKKESPYYVARLKTSVLRQNG